MFHLIMSGINVCLFIGLSLIGITAVYANDSQLCLG